MYYKQLLLSASAVFFMMAATAQTDSEKKEAWAAIQQVGSDSSKVLALLDYGALYYMSNYDSAEHYYAKARELALKAGFYRGYQRYISYQSEIYNLKGLFEQNLVNCRHGVEIARQRKDPLYQGVHLSNIGNIHLFKANHDSAAWYFMKASSMFEEAKDSMRLGQVYSNLSIVFENLGQADQSIYYNRRALDIARATGDELGVGYALTNLGAIFKKKQMMDSALRCFNEALPIALKHEDISLEKDVLIDLGFIKLHQENFTAADHDFTRAMLLSQQLKHDYGIVSAKKGLASCMIGRNEFAKASGLLKECIAIAQKNDFKEELQDLYLLQYETASKSNDHASALAAFRNYTRMKDSLTSIEVQKNIALLEKQYQTERKEKLLMQKDKEIQYQQLMLRNKNTWIYILLGFISLLGLIAFLSWKFLRQKRIADERKQELRQVQLSMAAREEERNRIARELHDDLGGTLSGIVVHTHFMTEQVQQQHTHEMGRSIEKIRHAASEMITKLNDIVWLVNPKYDTLGILVQRIEDFAMDLAKTKGMEVKVQVEEPLQDATLDPQARKNIYLIAKEAINNAVKYSHATELVISIHKNEDDVSISIRDNGKGFDSELVKKGNGLLNMFERAKSIGATYSLKATESAGTRIDLLYRIPH